MQANMGAPTPLSAPGAACSAKTAACRIGIAARGRYAYSGIIEILVGGRAN
jgi:hypothetical protein